jgi:hypothetical protein
MSTLIQLFNVEQALLVNVKTTLKVSFHMKGEATLDTNPISTLIFTVE